jgi:hypothetical protein
LLLARLPTKKGRRYTEEVKVKIETRADVRSIMKGYVTSAGLNAALELGLFWHLAEQARDAASVAKMLGIPAKRCAYWLLLLNSIGLLEETADGFAPSSAARRAILETHSQQTWAFLGQEEQEHGPAVHELGKGINEPRAGWGTLGLTRRYYVDRMRENPDRARRFTRMLYELHQQVADDLAETLELSEAKRMMDLGGGSGVMSMALLRKHPDLSSVVVDIENVCIAGREIAEENGSAAVRCGRLRGTTVPQGP